MKIRNLNKGDTFQVIELEKQLWYFFDSLLSEEISQEEVSKRDKRIEEGLLSELLRPDPIIKGVVAEIDNNLVGYLLYSVGFDPYGRTYKRTATFISLFAKEEYRGKVGLKLMLEGVKPAKQHDC